MRLLNMILRSCLQLTCLFLQTLFIWLIRLVFYCSTIYTSFMWTANNHNHMWFFLKLLHTDSKAHIWLSLCAVEFLFAFTGTNLFRYDNAFVHKASSIKTCCSKTGVKKRKWPEQNLDLNPSEHFCDKPEHQQPLCVKSLLILTKALVTK